MAPDLASTDNGNGRKEPVFVISIVDSDFEKNPGVPIPIVSEGIAQNISQNQVWKRKQYLASLAGSYEDLSGIHFLPDCFVIYVHIRYSCFYF
jgi:hypothetical protein